jgi:hypothetical protein
LMINQAQDFIGLFDVADAWSVIAEAFIGWVLCAMPTRNRTGWT